MARSNTPPPKPGRKSLPAFLSSLSGHGAGGSPGDIRARQMQLRFKRSTTL